MLQAPPDGIAYRFRKKMVEIALTKIIKKIEKLVANSDNCFGDVGMRSYFTRPSLFFSSVFPDPGVFLGSFGPKTYLK